MSEMRIVRNRGFGAVRRQTVEKTEKTEKSSAGGPVRQTEQASVSETLRQLLTRANQTERQIRAGRRTLQTGESALAEVQDSLERMAGLAREAAGSSEGRDALQAALEGLREDIDRILTQAKAGGARLFLDEVGGVEDNEALMSVLSEDSSAPQETELPNWLLSGLGNKGPSADRILSALGLDRTASGADILAALMDSSLETSGAASYLATMYLGASIASANKDPASAAEGLRQLLEMTGAGVPLDEAISLLTNGEFASLEDFQAQFTSGTAPGLETFLTNLLLAGKDAPLMNMEALLTLLAETGRMDLELALLDMLDLLELHQTLGDSPEPEPWNSPEGTVPPDALPVKTSVMDLGPVQVLGRDLSGVSFDADSGTLTVSETVTILGTAKGVETLRISGDGTVTIQNLRAASVTAEGTIFTVGRNVLGEVRMAPGKTLTLGGGGFLKIGLLQANRSNLLRLSGGGAVLLERREGDDAPLPVVIEGPAFLAAGAAPLTVSNGAGSRLEPFDVLWKTLLPGWSAVTSLEMDGKQARMALMNEEPARLWLDKGERGYPAHALAFRGQDKSGKAMVRYTYLHWNQSANTFEEITQYPNPFAVTGGEAGRDWIYEEPTHTLRILSNQVTGLSGGSGTDANQTPFSGRIALEDGIGKLELTLGGVVCRVSQGRAFSLGRRNDVTLMLQGGSRNIFEGGEGCAGLSLGEGTSLRIDCPVSQDGGRTPDGALTAIGNGGGAGIGRDSGRSRDQTSSILICGGAVSAVGNGGGAGIGGGKNGAMGSITILGGTVESTGENGAGIGGGLGAAVGDIHIRGGRITAVAGGHAAAIGAGVQGACGDIHITGAARILKALGGDPGADIGACLFGGCGQVRISGGADIGRAKLRTRGGVALPAGENIVTLPQFRLSVRTLGLDRLSLATWEEAQSAQAVLDAGSRWVSLVQAAYGSIYDRLNQSGLYSAQQYFSTAGSLVRDSGTAGTLLRDMSRSIARQSLERYGAQGAADVRLLLR